MDNNELILALGEMIDSKLSPIVTDMSVMKNDISSMKNDISGIKKTQESMLLRLDRIEAIQEYTLKMYDKLEQRVDELV